MSEELKALEEMLMIRRLHPAMRSEEDLENARKEAEEKEEDFTLHPLVLSPTRGNPTLIYIHPLRFLDELKKLGQTLNLQTLQFENITKKAPKPAAPKEEEKPAPIIEDKPADDEVPGLKKLDTYTKEELSEMSWEEIRAVAKADPDIPGNKSKDWLTENLVGRPKFPLAE